MSLDERLRAGLRQGVDGHSVSTSQALVEVEGMQTKQRTRSTMIGLVAAAALVVAGVVVGPGVVESLSGQPDVAPVQQPSDDEVVGVESARDLVGVWTTGGVRDVYFTFTPDGAFAVSRGGPTEPAFDSGIFRVDGSVLTLESTGRGCGGTIGRYLVTLPDPQTLSAALIEDDCSARAADFEKGAPVHKVPTPD